MNIGSQPGAAVVIHGGPAGIHGTRSFHRPDEQLKTGFGLIAVVPGFKPRYVGTGFGRAEDRFRRRPGEESPNTTGRDAA